MLNKKKNNKGFTLVELLVVIAIIGVLAVVAVPALFKNIEKSKVASLTADINAVRSASLAYYSDKNTYPTGDLVKVVNKEQVQDLSILDGNLENLSDPFKATSYKLEGTAGSDLTLEIKLPNALSENAQNKLKESLAGLLSATDEVKPEEGNTEDKGTPGDVGVTPNKVKVTILKADN